MSSPKVDQAIKLVKDLIQTGDIKPGEKLPNEADFANQLGVSRNSLREAVRAMQAMRILEARQGDGTYVSSLDPSSMIETLSFAVDVSGPQSIEHFLDVRRILEMHATAIAAAKRTADELETLKDCHRLVMQEQDPEKLLTLDSEFHLAIASIAQNPVLASLLNVVSAPALRARIWRYELADQDFSDLRREHQAILDAIEVQNVEAARFATWNHISGVIAWAAANPSQLTTTIETQGTLQ